jgi:hypothetical protein
LNGSGGLFASLKATSTLFVALKSIMSWTRKFLLLKPTHKSCKDKIYTAVAKKWQLLMLSPSGTQGFWQQSNPIRESPVC